ncbi:hypothetical protein SAMN05421542_4174 [Chryseobacterium jejuense]|uniref:Uncharacterized protein n=1 Tax=Chryseobacterium jejuense TaxID=445960 RepID=A0A2X2VC15_CHRJE|nr:hypothetical protein SAMN05421542_4174 [Chryseobacterium jejuense]SQB26496.1 Uncharacterised protein [Chryseobacterium jejuense]
MRDVKNLNFERDLGYELRSFGLSASIDLIQKIYEI